MRRSLRGRLLRTNAEARTVAFASYLAISAGGLLAACHTRNIELLEPLEDSASGVDEPPDMNPDDEPAPPISEDDSGVPPGDDKAFIPEDPNRPGCPLGALLCERFEKPLTGWTFVRTDGEASTTHADAHSGLGALELSTRTVGAFAYFQRNLAPTSSSLLYLRAFLKVPVDQRIQGYDVVTMDKEAPLAGVVASLKGSSLTLSNLATRKVSPDTLAVPRDTWVCLEITLSPSENRVTADANGKGHASLLIDDGVPQGGYSRIAIGIVSSSQAQQPTKILVDDLIVSSSPVGCDWSPGL